MEFDIAALIQGLAAKFPFIVAFLAAVGVFRMILKPLFAFAHSVADATPTLKDNEFLAKVEGSKVYKSIVFALDYLFSIKLIK